MPVQIFTSSPIYASEADGPTPNTAGPEPEDTTHDARAAGQPETAPATTTTTSTINPPSAQPGARPSLPVQTTAPQPARRTNYLPTQTQPPDPAIGTDITTSPPAPQPGAAPVPPFGGTQHHHAPPPPPPKTGTAPSSSSSYSYAASSAYTPRARYPRAQYVDDSEARNYSHPPGYQQNVHAAEFSSAQLAAHNQSAFHAGGHYGHGLGDEDGVWSTAKRWAAAAGESIMAAEEQIWKKINGD